MLGRLVGGKLDGHNEVGRVSGCRERAGARQGLVNRADVDPGGRLNPVRSRDQSDYRHLCRKRVRDFMIINLLIILIFISQYLYDITIIIQKSTRDYIIVFRSSVIKFNLLTIIFLVHLVPRAKELQSSKC